MPADYSADGKESTKVFTQQLCAKKACTSSSMALVPTSHIDNRTVQFVVDNTYKSIPSAKAKLDRTGKYRKVHEFTLYVDIVRGDPDLIERVLFGMGRHFEPQTFVSSCPIRVRQPNGLPAWRFCTTQQVCGAPKVNISVRGAGGSKMVITHMIRLEEGKQKRTLYTFRESRGPMPLRMVKIDEEQKFGIELELSSPLDIDSSMIADMMPRNAGRVAVIGTHSQGRQLYSEGWKIVPDGSIVCNRNMPACNKFELVSRVLHGGRGLSEVAAVTKSLQNARIQINKSMGFHVHIDVSKYSIKQLIKICQNFIKVRTIVNSVVPRNVS
jgi:Putative amidoligase enzyme